MKKIYMGISILLISGFLFACGKPSRESLPHDKRLTLNLSYQDFIDEEQLTVVDETLPHSMQFSKAEQVYIDGKKFDVKYYLDKSKGLNSVIYTTAVEDGLYQDLETYLTKIYGEPLSVKEEESTVWELTSEKYGDYFMNLVRDQKDSLLKISIIIKHFPK